MYYDLFEYAERVKGEAKEQFSTFPYMQKLCHLLEDTITGDLPNGTKNLAITIPPRTFKTTFVSQIFVAYCLAEVAPDCEFILTSYAAELAHTNAIKVKQIISAPWHKSLYPDVSLSTQDKNVQHFFKTDVGGHVYAVGMGGTVTGFGAGKARDGFGGAVIIDDPMKALDARSETVRKNVINYYTGTLKTRRNNADTTPIIIIAQRLHPDDLVGWVAKKEPEDWHIVAMPAEKDGAVLNPLTLNPKELQNMKEVDPFTYWAQYQQAPIIPGGNIIKLNWWHVYDPGDKLPHGLIYLTADTAFKSKSENDASVLQAWLASKKGLFFLDAVYGRWEFPRLLQEADIFWQKWAEKGAREFWIEDKASGTPLEQTLRDNGIPAQAWAPKDFDFPEDKVSRMQDASWLVHGGVVRVPKGSTSVNLGTDQTVQVTQEAAALLEECAKFSVDMSHSHDDHCDAFTMAVSLYKSML